MPKVSVIIPVYNTEKFLRKCLDSVCNQTLQDIEIICINDCSTDGALEILREYARKDKRIKLIELLENCGAAKARNIGIDIAEGEYIGFVDSDDFIDLDFYEKLYKKAQETDADAIKGKIKIHSNIRNVEKEVFYDINDDIKINKAYFYHSFTTAIYNTVFIKSNDIHFPEGLNNFEDPYFSILAGFYYNKVELVFNAYYHYVDNTASSSKIISSDIIVSIEKIYKNLNQVKIDVNHYIIVYDFLLKFLKPYIFNKENSIGMNVAATTLFAKMINNCKYKENAIKFYFYKEEKDKDKILKKEKFMNLRTNYSLKASNTKKIITYVRN